MNNNIGYKPSPENGKNIFLLLFCMCDVQIGNLMVRRCMSRGQGMGFECYRTSLEFCQLNKTKSIEGNGAGRNKANFLSKCSGL